MNEETETLPLIPNYPVNDFDSAKQRILLLESLCIKLKTSEDLAQLELNKAQSALTTIEEQEKQNADYITTLENKIIDKNQKIQDMEQTLTLALREKTEACETIKALKNKQELENEVYLIESKRKQQSMEFASEKLDHCEKRLHYLESAYEKLFNKMMHLYELSQNGETEKFDMTEFIIELRAEILSLKQKISDGTEREFLFKEAYEGSISELLQYRKKKENSSETQQELDVNSDDNFDDPDEMNSGDSKTEAIKNLSEVLISEEKPDKITVDTSFVKHTAVDSISQSENDQPLIDFFMNDLMEGSEKRRPRSAARLIDMIGEEAVPAIVKSASMTNAPYVKAALITELSKIRSSESTPLISAVLHFMDDEDSSVRNAAIDAFSQFAPITKKEHLPIIQKAVEDTSSVIRRKALILAATSKEIDPGVSCKQLLQDTDHQIRRLAAASFNSTKDPETVMALFEVVKDENDEVSAAAAHTLNQILGDTFNTWSQLKYENRVALVDNFTTYIMVRFNTFFPNGHLLSPLQYSSLFPLDMHVSSKETDHYEEESDNSVNSSISEKRLSQELEEKGGDNKPVENQPLFDKISTYIQSSLMGCTVEEIEREFSLESHILEQSIDQYIRDGKIVKRGIKLFLP